MCIRDRCNQPPHLAQQQHAAAAPPAQRAAVEQAPTELERVMTGLTAVTERLAALEGVFAAQHVAAPTEEAAAAPAAPVPRTLTAPEESPLAILLAAARTSLLAAAAAATKRTPVSQPRRKAAPVTEQALDAPDAGEPAPVKRGAGGWRGGHGRGGGRGAGGGHGGMRDPLDAGAAEDSVEAGVGLASADKQYWQVNVPYPLNNRTLQDLSLIHISEPTRPY